MPGSPITDRIRLKVQPAMGKCWNINQALGHCLSSPLGAHPIAPMSRERGLHYYYPTWRKGAVVFVQCRWKCWQRPRGIVCTAVGAAIKRYKLPHAGKRERSRASISVSGCCWSALASNTLVAVVWGHPSTFAGTTCLWVKPPTLSLPLAPNEVKLVGRTNMIYEIEGYNGRGKGKC